MNITTRRIYGDRRKGSEWRVLADRLWPRGISKEEADLDQWLKELAPSHELRSWFHDDRARRFDEFCEKYVAELHENTVDLADLVNKNQITLLTASRDIEQSHIPVLTKYLEQRLTER